MYRGGGGPFGVAAITGGSAANVTLSGTTNAVYTAPTGGACGIPFIHLSSGSVSAVGAITAITALPVAYPNAYCWFPANALATAIAAGWYYCTFSTTTAGTAFLDTYTSGLPTIPSSPTAVTDGKGAFTSDTASHNGPTISIAANALGANGTLRTTSDWQFNNTAGTKSPTFSYAGTSVFNVALSTHVSANWIGTVSNAGATAKNVLKGQAMLGSSAVTIAGVQRMTLDTTTAQNAIFILVKNTATDNLVLERYQIEVMYAP